MWIYHKANIPIKIMDMKVHEHQTTYQRWSPMANTPHTAFDNHCCWQPITYTWPPIPHIPSLFSWFKMHNSTRSPTAPLIPKGKRTLINFQGWWIIIWVFLALCFRKVLITISGAVLWNQIDVPSNSHSSAFSWESLSMLLQDSEVQFR